MRVRALAICYAVVLCLGGVLILVITRPGVVPGPWEPAIPSKTSSSLKNWSPVTMVVVTCATRLELTMNNLKSAVAFSRAPLRLLLYADVENIKLLQDWPLLRTAVVAVREVKNRFEHHLDAVILPGFTVVGLDSASVRIIITISGDDLVFIKSTIRQWPSSVLQRVTYSLRLVEFPMKSPHNWKELFRPCASQRLFLPSMLSEEDAVLYVDSDIVFFHPVEELWSIFDNMDDIQLAGLAPDIEDYNGSTYIHNGKTRYYGRYGLNSGVILMNLTRMRAYGLESLVMNLMDKYHSVMKLPDQDLLNMVFHDDPGRLYELPCRWDVLPPDCRASASCLGQTAAALHGTDQCFVFPGREPAYHAVFLAMKKYQLGSSLEQNFIDVLEGSLRSLNQTVCVGKLLGYLEHWRKLACLLDVEKDWNAS